MSKSNISYLDWVVNIYSQNCHKASEGCANCYAEAMAERFGSKFRGVPSWKGNQVKEFTKIPTTSVCGVNFLSDTWHEGAPLEWIDGIHSLIRQRPDVTFVYVTKRAERLASEAHRFEWPSNLWVGVSIELPKYLWRLDALRRVPTPNRWVSFEPLLGDLGTIDLSGIGWVVAGGESGEHYRPFKNAWAERLLEQCHYLKIPFYFKQGNGRYPDQNYLIDGREWRAYPAAFHQEQTPNMNQPSLF